MQELTRILRNGTFVPKKKEHIANGTCIFGSRFVDELKTVSAQLKKKERLVAQNYLDTEADGIETRSTTMQLFSRRLMLSLEAALPDKTAFRRDVTPEYIQSDKPLGRSVFTSSPA